MPVPVFYLIAILKNTFLNLTGRPALLLQTLRLRYQRKSILEEEKNHERYFGSASLPDRPVGSGFDQLRICLLYTSRCV